MGEYFVVISGSVFVGCGIAYHDYITIAAGITMYLAIIVQHLIWREHDRRNN